LLIVEKIFKSAGYRTTARPGPRQATARPMGRIGPGLAAHGPRGPARTHLYNALHQICDYLAGCKASPPYGWYHIILLGDWGTIVMQLCLDWE